jgi:hypothetical protein
LPKFPGFLGELLDAGGEHRVYFSENRSTAIKIPLAGTFGYVVDEEVILDDRTLLNLPKLRHRPSLPSEYLFRWAVLDQVFGLVTTFCGVRENEGNDASLVVSQPFIGSEVQDIPEWNSIEGFFMAHGFTRVDDRHIADPRIKGAVWYRQKDGLLISDAFPRNFRTDASGVVIPIDLVANIVFPGASKILPPAAEPFALQNL